MDLNSAPIDITRVFFALRIKCTRSIKWLGNWKYNGKDRKDSFEPISGYETYLDALVNHAIPRKINKKVRVEEESEYYSDPDDMEVEGDFDDDEEEEILVLELLVAI
jgi:hypothetical protein